MIDAQMLPVLFQAEWCPSSVRVRRRLTELQADVVLRQVEPEPDERDALHERTGVRGIPTMLLPDGTVHAGSDSILGWLDDTYAADGDPPSVAAHRDKAERARLKHLSS